MAVIGKKKQTFGFEHGEKITLRTMTPDEHQKYELQRDKCRFSSGKFNSQRYDALQKAVVTKLLVGWEGFERVVPGTENDEDPKTEVWTYSPEEVETFMSTPETKKFWSAAFSQMMVASVKSKDDEKPVDESDPSF